jgi:hypothetical protein
MKNSLRLLSMIILFLVTSCDKENVSLDRETITGRWKLTETLADIGNGSGKWTPVAPKDTKIVEFRADGSLSGNAFPDYVDYILEDSVTINLIRKDLHLGVYRYSFENGKLNMGYKGCIEACGLRFEKIE